MERAPLTQRPRIAHDDVVRAVGTVAVPRLADWCAVHLREGDDLVLAGVACADPADEELAHAYTSKYPPRIDDARGPGRVVRTGETYVALDVGEDHVRLVAKDAEQAELIRRIQPRSVVVAPLRGAQGLVLGSLTLCHARSGRRFTEADVPLVEDLASLVAAAMEERRARALLSAQNEAAPDGIFFQGADGRTAYYNQNLLRIWGVDHSVPAKATLEERLAAVMDRLADPEPFFQLAREVEEHRDRTVRVDVRSKDDRVLDCRTSPVRDTDGRFLGRVWYYRDVTAQRAMERELGLARREVAESERLALVGTLVSGVAHEVRTPLTYVGNNAFLLDRWVERLVADGVVDDARAAEARAAVAAVLDGSARINRLVGQLRHLTRRPRGRAEVDVDEAVRGAALLFQATHKDVVLEAVYGGAGRVLAEEAEIEQVVLNLLENASDASPPGSRVQVTTARGADGVRIAVRDWGKGIPPEIQARMFEPFFTTKESGLGLGLSIVHRILDEAGGRAQVASEPGRGTTVTLVLPAADARPAEKRT